MMTTIDGKRATVERMRAQKRGRLDNQRCGWVIEVVVHIYGSEMGKCVMLLQG